MRTVTRNSVTAILVLAAAIALSAAPIPKPDRIHVPGVFLDSGSRYVDVNYIKEEITFVNYVRDRQAADIHVIITVRRTGSGGREFTLQFIGMKDHKGDNREMKHYAGATDSEDQRRQGLVEKLKQGLIPYISDTPMADFISISYSGKTAETSSRFEPEDRWDHWSFRVGLHGDLNSEEYSKGYEYSLSLTANRVTRESKINFWAFVENEKTTYSYEEEGILEEYVSQTRKAMFFASYIKSLGSHWSLGGFFDVYSSTYENADIFYTAGVGLEYNIFPYEEYTRRELTLRTKLEYTRRSYNDMTIFGLTQENLFRQNLGIYFALKEPWGSVGLTLSGHVYYHDFSKNHFRGDVDLNINLLKGLSIHINCEYSRVRDQLSLPAESASIEEVLMELQERATGYDFSLRMGLSFRFGSTFSNVVNPRF